MKLIKAFIIFSILILIDTQVYPQGKPEPSTEKTKASLTITPAKINVNYRELITDDNGTINKTDEELMKINRLMKDSVLLWSKMFNLSKIKGFNTFGEFLGKRLKMKTGKKIEISFIDNTGTEETFILWCLQDNRFEFEKTIKAKRN